MQKIYDSIVALSLIVAISGCTSTGTDGTYTGDQNQNQEQVQNGQSAVQESVVPPQSQGTGLGYDLSGYLLPVKTLENQSVYKDFTITTQDSNGYFTQQQQIVKRYLSGYKNDIRQPVVNIFEGNAPNQLLVEKDVVTQNRISVFNYNGDGNLVTQEQYPRHIQKNEDLLRNASGACVLKEEIDNFDMSDGYVPVQANPIGHYNSVLHFYCGTTDGTKIDRYYADGWGQVLAIRQIPDSTTTYTVFDQNSYREVK